MITVFVLAFTQPRVVLLILRQLSFQVVVRSVLAFLPQVGITLGNATLLLVAAYLPIPLMVPVFVNALQDKKGLRFHHQMTIELIFVAALTQA